MRDGGGVTFDDERPLSPRPYDMRRAPYAFGYFVGDYAGLAASGSTFTPLWVQPFAKANEALTARVG